MLTWADAPTIKNACLKRLDKERGAMVCEVKTKLESDCIRVEIEALLDNILELNSCFELPLSFEIGHLHNEIDEVAEQYKEARKAFWLNGRAAPERQTVNGTGLRGRWRT